MSRECFDVDPEHVAAITGEEFTPIHPSRLRSRVAHSVRARLAARRFLRKLAALRNAQRPILRRIVAFVLRRKPPITPERAVVRSLIEDQGARHEQPWHFERPSWLRRIGR